MSTDKLAEAARRLLDMDVSYNRGPAVVNAVEDLEAALAALEAKPAPAEPVPEGWKLVLVPDELAGDEPDWDEVRHQAEVAYGLKVGDVTMPILIREVRRWIAQKWAAPAAPAPAGCVLVDRGALQMVRLALQRDADNGRAVRGEMLAALDEATSAAPAAPAPVPLSLPEALPPLPAPVTYTDLYGFLHTEQQMHDYALVAIEASKGGAA